MSMKFTPAAATSTTTRPGPGRGASRSATFSTSGPPRRPTSTTRMFMLLSRLPDQPSTLQTRLRQSQPAEQADRVDEITETHVGPEQEHQRQPGRQPPASGGDVPGGRDDAERCDGQSGAAET